MPITLITGPANSGKARSVLDALRREAARTGSALLVVPTSLDVERYARELASSSPTIGVRVTRFDGLMDLIVARTVAAAPELATPPLRELARERVVATLLGLERRSPASPGLAKALTSAIAELELAGVSPAALRSGQLSAVYRRYRDRLQRIGRLDRELRRRMALDVLRERPALWEGTPVLLYGFDDLTVAELDAIETLGRVVDAPLTVSLSYERGRVAFAGRAWAYEELRPLAETEIQLDPREEHYAGQARTSLSRIERSLFEVEQDDWEQRERATGASEEGVAAPTASTVAVVSPTADLRLFDLDRLTPPQTSAGDALPLDPSGVVCLLEGASQRAELELVALEASDLIDRGLSPAEIAIVHRFPDRIADELAEVLDAVGVPHLIVEGRQFSHTPLGRALLGLMRCGFDAREGEPRESRARLEDLLAWLRAPGVLRRVELVDRLEAEALRHGVGSAAEGRMLWERDHWRLQRIDAIAQAAGEGPLRLVGEAESALLWLFSARRLQSADVLAERDLEQELALRGGVAALRELRDLGEADETLLGGAEGVLATLETLQLHGRTTPSGEHVALLSPLSLRARRVKALFLCGLQEGVFPALGGGADLRERGDVGGLATMTFDDGQTQLRRRPFNHEQTLASERYLFYAALSRPEERLYLSWHEFDDDGATTPPSLFLDDVCDLFDERLWQMRKRRGLERSEADNEAERNDRDGDEATPRLLDETLLTALAARDVWSASSLERFAACPMRWFIERLLSAKDLEPDPEPLIRGSLAHDALDAVYSGLQARLGSAKITPTSLLEAKRLLREALAKLQEERQISVAREREPAAKRRLEADLVRYLEAMAEQEHPLEPRHLELPFGFLDEDERSLPALELGGDLRLRGRIDRVDVSEAGEAVVYDYKSGRVSNERSATKWLQRSDFQVALYMRAVKELTDLQPVGGLYQPLSGELRPRGAVSLDAEIELPCVRTDLVDGDELESLLSDVSDAAVATANEARSGLLQRRPQTCAFRGGCMYPTICRGQR